MPSHEASPEPVAQQAVTILANSVALPGDLAVPASARGLVLFAHGSGSSRHSPRNQQVAQALQQRGLATLLFDLLSAEEDAIDRHTRTLRFDIPLLARRLAETVDWAQQDPASPVARAELPLGLFGASTGAGAALVAAAARPAQVAAVVSRGGRPDLAGDALPRVQAPTLLIVGERDTPVLAMNRDAQAQLRAATELVVVPGATHLFEEPGTLERVAELAGDWLVRHLTREEGRPA